MSREVQKLRDQAANYRAEHERTRTFYMTGMRNQFYLELAIKYDRMAEEAAEYERKMIRLFVPVPPVPVIDSRTLLNTWALLGTMFKMEKE